nr:ParB/RepB/Spo0J family partition protein [Candidatus Nitrososphaera evergladensis]
MINASRRKYEVIAGGRRFRASCVAGLKDVPAIVKANADDRQVLAWAIIENLQRKDLTDRETAHGLKELYAAHGYDVNTAIQNLHIINNAESDNSRTTRPQKDFLSISKQVGLSAKRQREYLQLVRDIPEEVLNHAEKQGLSMEKKQLLTRPKVIFSF